MKPSYLPTLSPTLSPTNADYLEYLQNTLRPTIGIPLERIVFDEELRGMDIGDVGIAGESHEAEESGLYIVQGDGEIWVGFCLWHGYQAASHCFLQSFHRLIILPFLLPFDPVKLRQFPLHVS